MQVKKSTFKVLFYLKKNAPKKNGKVAIMGRITIDGKIAQFSTKLEIFPDKWDLKFGKVLGKSEEALSLNRKLEELRIRLVNQYDHLMKTDGFATAEKLKNSFLGISTTDHSLLKLFRKFNVDFEKMVAKDVRSQQTFAKYKIVYEHLSNFIEYKYHRTDIDFRELTLDFIKEFDFYLRINKGLTNNSVRAYVIPILKMVDIAIEKEIIHKNPFSNYEILIEERDKGFLLKEEIEQFLNLSFKNKTIELVRDLFVFSCFTGLSYIDIKQLKKNQIQTFFDGNRWILSRRKKTSNPSNVRLLPIAQKVIDKYESITKNDFVFPVPTNVTCNRYLKKISLEAGINKTKSLSFHWARHTFGTLFLTEGVPLESVSKMMGHKNLKTTQIYAKITNEKISKDLEKVAHKFDSLGQRFTSSL
ncbi:tyrosine recombinase [Capnocytophaga stomatis]|uniref:site-specific integrase n=1 Tax=Capnocytophaga stomatis TaxID=1848904 RepID=UPI0019500DE2|nr:site-specific integrase [Capnocytophaga stomatis]GIJ95635.1 tyrosine recombinase [Capnocytophaga stomatis]